MLRDVRRQRTSRNTIDELRRRVERAGTLPSLAGHQPLEDAPQHLRLDHGMTAVDIVIAGREAILLEHVRDGAEQRAVRQIDVRPPPLQRMLLEQSAIEIGQLSKRACTCGPSLGTTIQHAEEQRAQHGSIQRPRRVRPRTQQLRDEHRVAGEQSLLLQEIEEHEPRQQEQGEGLAILRRIRGHSRPRCRETRTACGHIAEEAL